MRPTFMFLYFAFARKGEGFSQALGTLTPVKASPSGRGRKGDDLETRTNKGGRKRTIYLDAVASRLRHKDPALVIHRHAGWPPKILFPFEPVGTLPLAPHLRIRVDLLFPPLGDRRVAGPGGDKAAIKVEDLQPVVQPVG